jgi:hypothetical protein
MRREQAINTLTEDDEWTVDQLRRLTNALADQLMATELNPVEYVDLAVTIGEAIELLRPYTR